MRIESVDGGDFSVVSVTRACPEKGGSQAVTENADNMLAALDLARSMASVEYEPRSSTPW